MDAKLRMQQDQSVTSGESPISWRRPLLEALGFVRDLFTSGVAEKELYESAEEAKRALQKMIVNSGDTESVTPIVHHLSYSPRDIFVNPFEPEKADELLRRKGHVAIVGEVGSGKTTLRLYVEDRIRLAVKDRLTVAYLPGRDPNRPLDNDAHLRSLARALTTDLFIQIVERNDFGHQPATDEQNEALLNLLQFEAGSFRETLHSLREGRVTAAHWGMAELWQQLSRHVVAPVWPTEHLSDWAADIITQLQRRTSPRDLSGNARWALALHATHLWGFKGVIVMVDSVDANRTFNSVANMEALLRPLLDRLTAFTAEGVELKFFLPAELEAVVSELRSHVIGIRYLHWTDELLQQVLIKRMEHSGKKGDATWGSLGELAEPGLRNEIDHLLIQEAKGSPRRLIKAVNTIINERTVEVAVNGIPASKRIGYPRQEAQSSTPSNFWLITRALINNLTSTSAV